MPVTEEHRDNEARIWTGAPLAKIARTLFLSAISINSGHDQMISPSLAGNSSRQGAKDCSAAVIAKFMPAAPQRATSAHSSMANQVGLHISSCPHSSAAPSRAGAPLVHHPARRKLDQIRILGLTDHLKAPRSRLLKLPAHSAY